MFLLPVVECVPVQNQAASQKLLQKMSKANANEQRSRGRKYRGKERQEEPVTFTLDEWEKRKANTKLQIKNEHMDTSHDEDLAWQLQSQLDLEDYHVRVCSFIAVLLCFLFSNVLQCLIEFFPTCTGTKSARNRGRKY